MPESIHPQPSRMRSPWRTTALALLMTLPLPSFAGYLKPGYDLQVVQSAEGLANSEVNYQTNALWSISGRDVPVNTSFTLPAVQGISFARLYLDVWGATATYGCQINALLNGTSLGTISVSGTNDTNPTFSLAQTSVYGSGAGAWQIAFGSIASLLHKDGTANTLSFVVSDTNNQFDGRTYAASLVSVLSDPSIDQTLDYYLAEADGAIRNTPGSNGSPSTRSLTFSGLEIANVDSATFHAGYTHGSTTTGTNNLDQVYFNENRLGPANNDATTGDTVNYPPNNLSFDVTGYLSGTSTIRYSVNNTELGGTGDSYLRPNIALLEITHVPEPTSVWLAILGGLALLGHRRSRTR